MTNQIKKSNWDKELVYRVWNDDMTRSCTVKTNIVRDGKDQMLRIASKYLNEKCKNWELTGRTEADLTL